MTLRQTPRWLILPIALIMAFCAWLLGYRTGQSDFGLIALGYVPFFMTYFWVARAWGEAGEGLRVWIALGLVLRLLLLFSFPALSDDVYRFVWDGRLLIQGYSPYARLPEWYLQAGHEVAGLEPSLFARLNSPRYFTVYPPLAQATFALAVWISPHSLVGSALVMKMILLLGELGSLALLGKLLRKWGLPAGRVLWYWLNPLIVIEVMGNLHYEGLMIFFVLLSLWLLCTGRRFLAGGALALGIATKLVPLLFLPLLLRRLERRGWLQFYGSAVLFSALFFLPLAGGLWLNNFGESLDLYFRKFEFNASLYYLTRWVGYQRVGYNMIARVGPVLAATTALIIFSWAWYERRPAWRNLPRSMLLAVVVYLILATTVHPWYISTAVVLCIFTPFRFPVLWSGLAVLTYVNYSYEPYWENLWVVALEYGLVFVYALWEVYRRLPEWQGGKKVGSRAEKAGR